MLTNMVNRQRVKKVSYSLEFTDGNGTGYGFPCDKFGNVFPLEYECARENLTYCMEHPEEFKVWNEVDKNVSSYTEPAQGKCECGREVYLIDEYYGACGCECGRWYNLFGQELLPPDQWEEDPADEEYY